ncbi:hypothetical protein Y032_0143g2427 [Ancylostoma ceylanicum]|uniref:Uncharacterized protein n=1 Tax=Ancylostoma ceylanicum TaxID=53326 RepID=A0A016T3H3_9BILA|nr:hypothetical protein Y032_0143g2427 [Ancylostoma ceylanicum]
MGGVSRAYGLSTRCATNQQNLRCGLPKQISPYCFYVFTAVKIASPFGEWRRREAPTRAAKQNELVRSIAANSYLALIIISQGYEDHYSVLLCCWSGGLQI